MKSLIGQRVRIMSKDYQILEGTIKEIEGNLAWLTEVTETTRGEKQPDQVINIYAGGFLRFAILEKEVCPVT